MESGVYKISNKINGKVYIGSSCNLKRRKYSHFSKLRKGLHNNRYLQNSWNKYGEETRKKMKESAKKYIKENKDKFLERYKKMVIEEKGKRVIYSGKK